MDPEFRLTANFGEPRSLLWGAARMWTADSHRHTHAGGASAPLDGDTCAHTPLLEPPGALPEKPGMTGECGGAGAGCWASLGTSRRVLWQVGAGPAAASRSTAAVPPAGCDLGSQDHPCMKDRSGLGGALVQVNPLDSPAHSQPWPSRLLVGLSPAGLWREAEAGPDGPGLACVFAPR